MSNEKQIVINLQSLRQHVSDYLKQEQTSEHIEYMRGFYNGVEYMLSEEEEREAVYIAKTDVRISPCDDRVTDFDILLAARKAEIVNMVRQATNKEMRK